MRFEIACTLYVGLNRDPKLWLILTEMSYPKSTFSRSALWVLILTVRKLDVDALLTNIADDFLFSYAYCAHSV